MVPILQMCELKVRHSGWHDWSQWGSGAKPGVTPRSADFKPCVLFTALTYEAMGVSCMTDAPGLENVTSVTRESICRDVFILQVQVQSDA